MDFSQNNISGKTISRISHIEGNFDVILDKKLPEQSLIKYKEFLLNLENDIEFLKLQINYEILQKPQIYSLFVKILQKVVIDYMNQKVLFYENALINILRNSYKTDKVDFFFSLTEQFSKDDMLYLYIIYTEEEKLKEKSKDSAELLRRLTEYFSAQRDYILCIVVRLERLCLISGVTITTLGKEYCDFIFMPKKPEQP